MSTFADRSAGIDHLWGVALDPAGNVFYTDWARFIVGKITPAGLATAIAGGGFSPQSIDGSTAVAKFNYPSGITVDAAGNLYVAEWSGSHIRKISPSGTVTTLPALAEVTDAYTYGLTMDPSDNLVRPSLHRSS